jgi:hypothetical protein
MIKTPAQQEFRVAIDSFIASSRKNYDGYAYATGYLSSTVVEMLNSLTKKQQKSMIQSLQAAALHQQKSTVK